MLVRKTLHRLASAHAQRWAVGLVSACAAVTASNLEAQRSTDSVAVVTAALKIGVSASNQAIVRAYPESPAGSATSVASVVARAAQLLVLPTLRARPKGAGDANARVSTLLDMAAWIPTVMAFDGDVGITSFAWESASRARVTLVATLYDRPKPSGFVTTERDIVLSLGPDGQWKLASDSVLRYLHGQFAFARPEYIQEPSGRIAAEKDRALLRSRGIAVP